MRRIGAGVKQHVEYRNRVLERRIELILLRIAGVRFVDQLYMLLSKAIFVDVVAPRRA
jgi:hypothetical protein